MGSLYEAFRTAVGARAEADIAGAKTALQFIEEHGDNVSKVLSIMGTDGELKDGAPLPASCFNDFYKWTMLPVMRAVERAHGDIRSTFSVNIRDTDYRKQLHESATGKVPPDLFNELKQRLSGLSLRKFDRGTFERCVTEYKLPGWEADTLEAVCGTREQPRALVQEFRADPACSSPAAPSAPGNVLVQVFVAHDGKLEEDRVYVEATGPWHRVTWLETSMMQAVYDALLRDQKRKEFGVSRSEATGSWDDGSWYPQWLADAFCRCVRSLEAAVSSGLKGALFTGRRTGGLAIMMLQGLYAQHAFKGADGAPLMLGSSSVTARYASLDAGVAPEHVPRCAGTHAHELSMVVGAVLGELDDRAGMPVSQLVGHLLYFYASLPQGDVQDASRKVLMPMLPDTLGSRAFMKVAERLTVPTGPHKGAPVLSIVGAARQDSGGLEAFRDLMGEFGFKGALMASEIEVPGDLMTAAASGYRLFGAGGFMGDSEKAWDAGKKNISMAVKVLRVYVNGERSPYSPVKTGEISDEGKIKEGKFEADGTLSDSELKAVRERAQVLASAEPKMDAPAMQDLFDRALASILSG